MIKPGSTFGKYQILSQIGQGGMAVVFEAVDTTLNRHVALKVLPPHFSSDEERSTRFRKEVLAVAALDHPSVVTIFEVNEVDDLSYFAMSLATGGNLKERISDKKLSPTDSLRITRHIAAALNHAHSMDIIHRDIKPENILFTKDDIPVLADFGIAKLVTADTNLTSQGQSLGTPYYMSPEQAQAQRDIDHRSDLYSLAVVLYEMLTGSPPYNANTALGIALMHVSDPLPRLPAHLGMIQPLIDRAMAKNPSDRYQDATSLTEAIDALSEQIKGLGDDLAVRKSIRQRQVTRRDSDNNQTPVPDGHKPAATPAQSKRPPPTADSPAAETPAAGKDSSRPVAPGKTPSKPRKKPDFTNPVEQRRRKRFDTQFDLMAVTPPPGQGVSSKEIEANRQAPQSPPVDASPAEKQKPVRSKTPVDAPEPVAESTTAATKPNRPFETEESTRSAASARPSSQSQADLTQTVVSGMRPAVPAEAAVSAPTRPAPPMQTSEPDPESGILSAGLKLWLPVAGLVIAAIGLLIWMLIPESDDKTPAVVQNNSAQSPTQQESASSQNQLADDDVDSFFDAFDSPDDRPRNSTDLSDETLVDDPLIGTTTEPDWPSETRDEPLVNDSLADRSEFIDQLPNQTDAQSEPEAVSQDLPDEPVDLAVTADPELAQTDERLLQMQRINLLLDQAQGHLRANRLTRPEGNNAVDVYRQILNIDPQNSSATDGLQRVASSLIDLASRRLEDSGDQSAARALLNRAVSIGGTSNRSERLRRQIEEYQPPSERLVNQPRAIQPGRRFSDLLGNSGNQGPLLIEVPSGSMVLGADVGAPSNQPPYSVEFNAAYAIGATEVTRTEFARFIDQSGYLTDAQRDGGSCTYWVFGWTSRPGKNWENPGFDQGGNDPVVCVSHADAQAYLSWLSKQTGERYRLPTESEWEYAARLGVQPGELTAENICEKANIADLELASVHKTRKDSTNVFQCEDGYGSTSAVARFDANPLGLFDTIGNASEWVADCWTANHSAARSDGSAVDTNNCTEGVSRGGSWIELPANTSTVSRVRRARGEALNHLGFRVLREL